MKTLKSDRTYSAKAFTISSTPLLPRRRSRMAQMSRVCPLTYFALENKISELKRDGPQ
jgi:hypothetical protein